MAKKEKIYDCSTCTINPKIKESKKVKIFGNKESPIIFVIDMIKQPYLQILSDIVNIEEFGIVPVIACNEAVRNKLTDVQIKCCLHNFYKLMEEIKPLAIISLGNTATNAVLKLKSKIEISKLRNRVIPNHFFNCITFPTYHPEDAFNFWVNKQSFYLDLEKYFYLFKEKYDTRKKVNKKLKETNILKDYDVEQIVSFSSFEKKVIKNIEETEAFSFDYETNSLRPFDATNFKVYTAGFGIENKAWVVHLDEFDKINKFKEVLRKLLTSKNILKIIQNKQYEEMCSRNLLGYDIHKNKDLTDIGNIISNSYDIMLATHVLDHRGGCTSLDFQNLVRFGMHNYDDEIYPYMGAETPGGINKIDQIPIDKLVQYNGLDCITTWYNYEYLIEALPAVSDKFEWCFKLLNDGHDAFVNMSWEGFPSSKESIENLDILLENKAKEITEIIYNMEEVNQFIENKGYKYFIDEKETPKFKRIIRKKKI